jgi:hypothetical protein
VVALFRAKNLLWLSNFQTELSSWGELWSLFSWDDLIFFYCTLRVNGKHAKKVATIPLESKGLGAVGVSFAK